MDNVIYLNKVETEHLVVEYTNREKPLIEIHGKDANGTYEITTIDPAAYFLLARNYFSIAVSNCQKYVVIGAPGAYDDKIRRFSGALFAFDIHEDRLETIYPSDISILNALNYGKKIIHDPITDELIVTYELLERPDIMVTQTYSLAKS